MPKDDDLGVGKRLVELGGIGAAELVAMRQDDRESVQLDLGHLGQFGANVEGVAVSVDGWDRSDRLQLGHHVPLPHIAAAENVIDLPKEIEDLRTQKVMAIGDDAQAHAAKRGVTYTRSAT